VLLGLSGGVDSSVVAALLHKAIGEQRTCVFVDHGLLCHQEGDRVMQVFARNLGVRVIRVDAAEHFYAAHRRAGWIPAQDLLRRKSVSACSTPGRAVLALRLRYGGRRKTLSLGAYPDVPTALAQARHRAARWLLAAGIDSSLRRRELRLMGGDSCALANELPGSWRQLIRRGIGHSTGQYCPVE
jgi:hypothetical protein